MKPSLKSVAKTSAIPSIMAGMGIAMLLDVDSILVDPIYQRGENRERQRNMSANWNWRIYTPLNIAERPDGSYYSYDGGNRALAAKMAGITHLPCYVVKSKDAVEEAKDFVALNNSRVRLKPLEIFRAMEVAGSPIQLFISEAWRNAGITPTDDSKCGINKTNAINAFVNHFKGRKFDEARQNILDCIEIINAAWGGQAKAFSGRSVEGMLRVLTRIGNREELLKHAEDRLGRHRIDDLLMKANGRAHVCGGAITAALPEIIIETFNYRLSKNKLA